MAFHRSEAVFLVEGLESHRLRHGIGHVEEGGDTAKGGSPALARDVGLLGESRFPEMHMGVDDSRHDDAPHGVYASVIGAMGRVAVEGNLADGIAIDDDMSCHGRSLVDDCRIRDKCSHLLTGVMV